MSSVSWGCRLIWGSTGEGSAPHSHPCCEHCQQFLTACWISDLGFLLTVDWRPPLAPRSHTQILGTQASPTWPHTLLFQRCTRVCVCDVCILGCYIKRTSYCEPWAKPLRNPWARHCIHKPLGHCKDKLISWPHSTCNIESLNQGLIPDTIHGCPHRDTTAPHEVLIMTLTLPTLMEKWKL